LFSCYLFGKLFLLGFLLFFGFPLLLSLSFLFGFPLPLGLPLCGLSLLFRFPLLFGFLLLLGLTFLLRLAFSLRLFLGQLLTPAAASFPGFCGPLPSQSSISFLPLFLRTGFRFLVIAGPLSGVFRRGFPGGAPSFCLGFIRTLVLTPFVSI
jgi:hypothetical protein